VGGGEPVKLDTVMRELKVQSVRLAGCYGRLQKLVAEQSNAHFADASVG
jgi:hypothetical protein